MNGRLLDSHTFLWFVEDDPRLPATVKALLEDEERGLWLSAASAFEIAIKHGLGKLPLDVPLRTLLDETLRANDIGLLPIEPRHLVALAQMPLPTNGHRDPFDRLLVAQSLTDDLPLVSGDRALDVYRVQRTWSDLPIGGESGSEL